MKMFVAVHSQLSPLHKGIQAAHAVAEYLLKFPEMGTEWAKEHKTLILFDGGFTSSLLAISDYLDWLYQPKADFYEDVKTNGGQITAVAWIERSDRSKVAEILRLRLAG